MVHVTFDGLTLEEVKAQMHKFLAEEKPAEPKPAEVSAPEIDIAEVRKACLTFRDKNGQAALSDVFAKLGAKKLTDIPAEKYGELMEMVK